MEHRERDKRIWLALCRLLSGWLTRKFNLDAEPVEAEGPFLVLANHATDWDPLLLATSFKKTHMYFVASEHIFRWGFLWRLIDWLLHPIARLKGVTATDTVMTVMRRMKKGANVAIFAEGNRTWDGVTGDILPSTGKLARSCGGSLITYRFEGGYFTSPRWSGNSLRRGRMRGYAVGIYSRDELRAMTPQQINDIINRDLHEDAYARQRVEQTVFSGKNLAEGMETMLCVCPVCGALGALRSHGDYLSCSACGLDVRYTERGFLEGEGLPFDNIADWDVWQTEKLGELAVGSGGGVICSDDGVHLDMVFEDHRQLSLGDGDISVTDSALACCGRNFALRDITGMGMHGPMGLSFSVGAEHYELSCAAIRCLRKYMLIYERLRAGAEYGKEVVI